MEVKMLGNYDWPILDYKFSIFNIKYLNSSIFFLSKENLWIIKCYVYPIQTQTKY